MRLVTPSAVLSFVQPSLLLLLSLLRLTLRQCWLFTRTPSLSLLQVVQVLLQFQLLSMVLAFTFSYSAILTHRPVSVVSRICSVRFRTILAPTASSWPSPTQASNDHCSSPVDDRLTLR